jgi:D-3-phosphoglycerate dehydrogenase
MGHRVVLSDNKTVDPETQEDVLEAAGADVEVLEEKTESAVEEALQGADGMITDAATPVTREVLEATDSLQVVGRAGIGVDNVDVAAAEENDIRVVHVPDYCLDEVSTHALALLLACVRSVPVFDRQTRSGEWDWEEGRPIHRMRGRTLGLAGFGQIAQRLASKVRAYQLDVVAFDPNVEQEVMTDHGVEKVDFDELLTRSDYLSVHIPLFEDTRHLFSTAEFEQMSDDAVLVNTSRGPIVDGDALHEALANDELGRAGLDVMEEEPPDPDHPLFDLDETVITPHVGWYSEESRRDLSRSVASDVAAVLEGEDPKNPVDPDLPWV